MDVAPGDDLVPGANMVFDRSRDIAAPPQAIWPWLEQLGKQRAGWYLPRTIERMLPAGRRALRRLEPRFQQLAVGDTIPDYGGRGAQLEVALIEPPTTLVYRDVRRGTPFSWAITVARTGPDAARVHLRFRGELRSTGSLRRVIVAGARLFDGLTGEAMLRGLDERVTGRRGEPAN